MNFSLIQNWRTTHHQPRHCAVLRRFAVSGRHLLFLFIFLWIQPSVADRNQCADLFFSVATSSNSKFLSGPGSGVGRRVGIESLAHLNLGDSEALSLIRRQSARVARPLQRILGGAESALSLSVDLNEFHRLQNGTYSKTLQAILRNNKIDFEVVKFKLHAKRGEENADLEIQFILISQTGPHRLNKFSRSIFRRHGVRLAYNPAFNAANHFAASFASASNMYFLQDSAIFGNNFSLEHITRHELKHAIFHAERAGSFDPIIQAPVHATLTNPYVTNTAKDPYAAFLNFEELVTYPISVSALAKEFSKKKQGELSHANFVELKLQLNILSSVSQRIIDLGQSGLRTLASSDAASYNIGLNLIEVTLPTGEQITQFAPPNDLEIFRLDPVGYAKQKLNAAIGLARFNLNYLDSVAEDAGHESVTQRYARLARFRNAQAAYLEQNKTTFDAKKD